MTRTRQTNPNEAKCSKNANRPSTYKKGPPGFDTYACNMALNVVARKVEIMKANNGGVAPYDAVSATIVSKMKPTPPWLNVEMLRSQLKKLNKQKSKQPAECATTSPAANVGVGTINDGDSSHSTLTVDTIFPVDDSSIGDNNNTTTPSTSNGTSVCAAGRPTGSITSNKRDLNTLLP